MSSTRHPPGGSIRQLVERCGRDQDVDTLEELTRRGVVRVRSTNPCGEYAEYLVERALDGTRAPVGTPSYDVELVDGTRVQVRARHVKSRLPKHIKVADRLDDCGYDELALVMFRPDYVVDWAYVIPRDDLQRLAVKYQGTAYRLLLPGHWRHDPAARLLQLTQD